MSKFAIARVHFQEGTSFYVVEDPPADIQVALESLNDVNPAYAELTEVQVASQQLLDSKFFANPEEEGGCSLADDSAADPEDFRDCKPDKIIILLAGE